MTRKRQQSQDSLGSMPSSQLDDHIEDHDRVDNDNDQEVDTTKPPGKPLAQLEDWVYGRQSFTPLCERCLERGKNVPKKAVSTPGPYTRYKCPECGDTHKQPRPVQRIKRVDSRSYAARPDMDPVVRQDGRQATSRDHSLD